MFEAAVLGSRTSLPQMASNVAVLVSDIDCTFNEVEEVKTSLEDPDVYEVANPVAAATTGGGGAAAGGGAKVEEKKVVEEEGEEEMVFAIIKPVIHTGG